jgi:hypothetical protein
MEQCFLSGSANKSTMTKMIDALPKVGNIATIASLLLTLFTVMTTT